MLVDRKTFVGHAKLAAALALGVVAALCVGCSREPKRTGKPEGTTAAGRSIARRDMVEALKEDLKAPRHPSDGGGSVRLIEEESTADVRAPAFGKAPLAIVSTPGRWSFLYTAGPDGIAEGGMLFFQAPPFWGWSPPQVSDEQAPGYTTVATDAKGVRLEPRAFDNGLLGITIRGRRLEAGEQVRIVYGAGPAGALADRYAEHDSRFWFAVDGDGDGVRALVADPPAIDVAPGPPARMLVTIASTAKPGDVVRLVVAILDRAGNAGVDVTGEVRLEGAEGGLDLPERIVLRKADRGRHTVWVLAKHPGIYRIRATGPAGLTAESNPLVVGPREPRIVWADLHGHSNLSDGTGTPRDYFTYARDVAGLDAAALTDHDHWGMEFLDAHPEHWQEIVEAARQFYRPESFVALAGFEWTSWIYGHRHVLFFQEGGQVLSSLDPNTDTPAELWQAIGRRRVLTIAHHPAGGPIATDWSVPPHSTFEPVTEIVSVHGCSEAPDCPARIYDAVEGHYVRDALARGYRLGFTGGGDTHDGHPGLGQLGAPSGGLTAVVTEALTRETLLLALHFRRIYATNGPRIVLRMALDDRPMGAPIAPGDHDLFVRVVATAPLERVDVVRSGRVVDSIDGGGRTELTATRSLSGLTEGEYVYVRVLQKDGGAAWASPVFVEEPKRRPAGQGAR
ncbi:MAG: DUF3604 domain-containing protein [Candidatus Dadabacteria bacterium]|nr:MAG: DUF3604 domain-containing protein [Candidatus Dadabacteria bacterium]